MAALVIACALAVQGCGSSTSFEEETPRLASIAAGTTMLVQAWCDGSVPRAYALRTVEHAGESLDRVAQSLETMAGPPERLQETEQEIAELRAAMRTTHDALQREDRGAALSALAVLRRLESEARQETLAETSS
jgi:hypothetical protein